MASLTIDSGPDVVALMVVKNEMDRWLNESLRWLIDSGITVFVLDDGSTDGTREFCEGRAAHTRARHPSIPSFSEDESAFREAAWSWVAGSVDPSTWIIVVDADEFPTTDPRKVFGGLKVGLQSEAKWAEESGRSGVCFPIPEIFEWNGESPQRRVDGYWGDVSGVRMARADTPREFFTSKEGCGSVPRAAISNSSPAVHGEILHLGYLNSQDRADKFARYSKGGGHNPKHINSILAKPTLTPWNGMVPAVLDARVRGE